MPANPYAPPGAPLHPGKKASPLKTLLWVAVALAVLGGVIAAIAIPAHYDRVYRSRVASAVGTTSPFQAMVTEYYYEHRRLPQRPPELLPPELALAADGVLTWTFPKDAGAIAGRTLVFRPRSAGDTLVWDCRGGTLESRYRVHACR